MAHPRPRVILLMVIGLLAVACAVAVRPTESAGGEPPDAAKARETFQALFGDDLAKVQATGTADDDLALAGRLVETARGTTGQAAFVALLAEHAYRLSADRAQGYATAIRAMDLLAEREPDRAPRPHGPGPGPLTLPRFMYQRE